MCCIHQTAFAIQFAALYRPNSSCHTAVCAEQTKQQLPYNCLYCIDQTAVAIQLSVFTDQTAVAIQLSVLYRTNISCHTAVCAVQNKQQLPYSCLYCIDQTAVVIQLSVFTDQTAVAIQLSVLYTTNSICHTVCCPVYTKQQLPYSCLCCIHQTAGAILLSVLYRPTAVAIQLSVLYTPNSSCHTAVCAVQSKYQLPFSCL